jgi:hypothetical protein
MEISMGRRDGIQLAIGEPTGLRGSLWDIWFGAQDIYVSVDHMFGQWKTTIHYERSNQPGRVRYTGFTTQFARKMRRSLGRADRATYEWPGLELRPGSDCFLEFRLRIPASELRPIGSADLRLLNRGEPLSIRWLPVPRIGPASEVSIISGSPTHSGPRPNRENGAPDRLILERRLGNGRIIWIIQHDTPAPSASRRTSTGTGFEDEPFSALDGLW